MATVHEMIQNYRPELELEDPLTEEEAVASLAEKAEVEADVVRKVLSALPDLLLEQMSGGRPVELTGVGQIRPTIDLDGTIRGALVAESGLVDRLSEAGAYHGGINRRENIGAKLSRLAQMWNASHPDDPVIDVDAYAIVGE